MIKLKSINLPNFSIELLENKDYYIIKYSKGDKEFKSEQIINLRIANDLFDIKLQELEGH